MILRVLLTLFLSISLYAANDSWYSKIDATVEVGIFLPESSGSISNLTNSAEFQNDLGYSDTEATYLSAEILLHYTYAPNILFGYFNMQDNANSQLTKKIQIADVDFNSSITSQIEYQVFNVAELEELVKNNRIDAKDISFVVSDANGLPKGDKMRAKAISNVFGKDVPVTSYKSVLGETYGASGMLDIVSAIADIEENRISPIFGDIQSIDGIDIVTDVRSQESNYVLVTSFTSDGNCTAVIIKKR
jgi:3-oxoacyl-(acyl-carrier-protein) synthase